MAKMVITIDSESGKSEVTSPDGKVQVYDEPPAAVTGNIGAGVVLFIGASPGCVYYYWGGRWYRVC